MGLAPAMQSGAFALQKLKLSFGVERGGGVRARLQFPPRIWRLFSLMRASWTRALSMDLQEQRDEFALSMRPGLSEYRLQLIARRLA